MCLTRETPSLDRIWLPGLDHQGAADPRRARQVAVQSLASALIREDRREIFRDTVLACATPLVAARCNSGCAARNAAAAAALSPPAIAVSTSFTNVRTRD